MTSDDLHRHYKVEFKLAGQLVQGLVIGDKHKKIIIMRNYDGEWRPIFVPLELLTHITFQHASKLSMPVYNIIMERILGEARDGLTDGW